MPGQARKNLVRAGEIGVYHTWSRCVQSTMLCGLDPLTGVDYDYRRGWIKSLLEYQAGVFAVDVGNYSVLSNHQHLIVRTRPDVAALWSDEEVAWRWKLAWPRWLDGQWVREPTDEEVAKVLAKPERLAKLRSQLASLSLFMARWKEPVARLANAETGKKGHFYEQRFGSREIVDDAANLCCNVYVDLNQMKAGLAPSLEASRCSAIHDRLQAWRQEQVAASLEKFHDTVLPGFTLQAQEVEQLWADCFLAPIGDQGPPLLAPEPGQLILPTGETVSAPLSDSPPDTPPAATDALSATAPLAASPEEVPSTNNPGLPSPKPVTAPAAGCEAAASTAPPNVARGSKVPGGPPTRKIHQRLQSGRRRRASDHVFLGVPRAQYLQLVQWTGEELLERKKSQLTRPPPEEVVGILRQWGLHPAHWCDAIEKFGTWFHRVVGHPDKLVQPLERTQQQWFQGIRACRKTFT